MLSEAAHEELRKLYHDISIEQFSAIVKDIPQEAWDRWLAHKDEYYKMCKEHIGYKVRHHARNTPINPKDIEGAANLIFCIACLRWDPEGPASLPTYVANQLGYLSGYFVGPETKHKNNITAVEVDGKRESILDIVGSMDPDNSLVEYIEKAGPDVKELYTKIHEGWYERKTAYGSSRAISAVGLYRSKVFGWNLVRCQNALKGLQQALDAWQRGKEYKGYAALMAV